MITEINKKYLITTNEWFIAPDGNTYKSVFGKVTGIHNDSETLGIKTNRHSANWYVEIGNMIIAGCQIHYVIKTESVSLTPMKRDVEHNGLMSGVKEAVSRIYDATPPDDL